MRGVDQDEKFKTQTQKMFHSLCVNRFLECDEMTNF